MEFKKFSGKAGSFNFTNDGKIGKPEEGLNYYSKLVLDEASASTTHQANGTVEEVLLHLALCHSVIIDKRTNKMNSASPDELALVEGASSQGFEFEGKDADGIISIKRKRDGQILRFELLNTLEFDSARKRMSVILKDLQTQEITLLCKGADSIIKERLDLSGLNKLEMATTQKYVDAYAEEGLRTLLLAKKSLDKSYYSEWNERFQEAIASIVGKDEKVEAVQSEIESGMTLVGSTAIEDKL